MAKAQVLQRLDILYLKPSDASKFSQIGSSSMHPNFPLQRAPHFCKSFPLKVAASTKNSKVKRSSRPQESSGPSPSKVSSRPSQPPPAASQKAPAVASIKGRDKPPAHSDTDSLEPITEKGDGPQISSRASDTRGQSEASSRASRLEGQPEGQPQKSSVGSQWVDQGNGQPGAQGRQQPEEDGLYTELLRGAVPEFSSDTRGQQVAPSGRAQAAAGPQPDEPGAPRSLQVASRGQVLKACTMTCGGLAVGGLLLREGSHWLSAARWPLNDCTLVMPFNLEVSHLGVVAGLTLGITGARQMALILWPDFATATNVLTKLEPIDLLWVSALSGISEVSSLAFSIEVAIAIGPSLSGKATRAGTISAS
eukprot:jgi/Mesen1/7620/ME000004S07891